MNNYEVVKEILDKKIKEYVKRNGLEVLSVSFKLRRPDPYGLSLSTRAVIAFIHTRNRIFKATMEYGIRIKRHKMEISQ